MFDVGFSELMLIGLVALIVIGPERLPKVARTIGHLVGRAQRYVSDVKTDIQREMDLSDLNELKNQMQDAAQAVKTSMADATDSLRKPLDEAQQALNEASASVDALVHSAKAEAGPTTPKDADGFAEAQAAAAAVSGDAQATPAVAYEHEPLAEPPDTPAYEPEVVQPAPTVAPAVAPEPVRKADSSADTAATTTPASGTRP
ncbi:twin-arginine translocase subunit TatB [Parapusillimonas sp. SGNA-6]|nr:twin-arginine translocase subunit TatB [Parapusillimonas sp. SGNA-6]